MMGLLSNWPGIFIRRDRDTRDMNAQRKGYVRPS